jgi:hypothetical protein
MDAARAMEVIEERSPILPFLKKKLQAFYFGIIQIKEVKLLHAI